jgi:hypothetical protein
LLGLAATPWLRILPSNTALTLLSIHAKKVLAADVQVAVIVLTDVKPKRLFSTDAIYMHEEDT